MNIYIKHASAEAPTTVLKLLNKPPVKSSTQ